MKKARISIGTGLFALLLLISCGKGEEATTTSTTDNKFVNQMAATGTAGCGVVEAFEETDSKARDTFLMKLSVGLWRERLCGTKREVHSFGGEIVNRSSEYTLNQTTTACSSNAVDRALESIVPKSYEKLVAMGVSEKFGDQRILTWVTEDVNKQAKCQVMAIDFRPPSILRLGTLIDGTINKKPMLSMPAFFVTQQWRDMDKF